MSSASHRQVLPCCSCCVQAIAPVFFFFFLQQQLYIDNYQLIDKATFLNSKKINVHFSASGVAAPGPGQLVELSQQAFQHVAKSVRLCQLVVE